MNGHDADIGVVSGQVIADGLVCSVVGALSRLANLSELSDSIILNWWYEGLSIFYLPFLGCVKQFKLTKSRTLKFQTV